jgi:diguanylate cyclase (GGDEF)-like protein
MNNQDNCTDNYIPTILAIDDLPDNLDILVEHYENENVHLTVALSGADGLKLAKTTNPDLILLDIMMPDMDGYEVCRRLKADPQTRHIPVIFVTAMGEDHDEQKGLLLGAVDYIAKPFVFPVLQARVRNHLEIKHRNDLLVEMAFLDGLTGIANRRRFDQQFDKEWCRHRRNGQTLSVIMIDVDYFKRYNDFYGHGMGDTCLKAIATALQQTVKRPGDLVARYGGEEFVVLLPETSATDAHNIAQTLCRNVANLQLPHQQSDAHPHVTISLGCSSSLSKQNDLPSTMLRYADGYLYMAKELGRNQVISQLSLATESVAAA